MLDLYEREGAYTLTSMSRWVRKDPELTRTLRQLTREARRSPLNSEDLTDRIIFARSPVHSLFDVGLLRKEDGRVTKDPAIESLMREFLSFLPSSKKTAALR